MTDQTKLFIIAGLVTVVLLIIGYIGQRSKTQGNLFTRPPTLVLRLFAGLLGLLLVGLALVIYWGVSLEDARVFDFIPLVGFALIVYSLGGHKFLLQLQGGPSPVKYPESPQPVSIQTAINSLGRLLLIAVSVLGVSLAVTYGLIWVLGQPPIIQPLVIALLCIIMPILPFVDLFHFVEILRRFKGTNSNK